MAREVSGAPEAEASSTCPASGNNPERIQKQTDNRRCHASDSEYPGDIVRLSCEKCGRAGQYRKQTLVERYGADIRLPDLREEIAQCERLGQMHDACMVRYVDLVPR